MSIRRHARADRWPQALLAAERGALYPASVKIEPRAIPPARHTRLGAYDYVGDDAVVANALTMAGVTLRLDAGFLFAEGKATSGKLRRALNPLDDHTALIEGIGRGRGDR
ncbi:MAG: hypothetical protein ACFCUJ_15030 [Thiotrichales bacterium]